MPILICCTKTQLKQTQLNKLVLQWSRRIQVTQKDISIQVVANSVQAGAGYELVANLYLPSVWPETKVRYIQESLLVCIEEVLEIRQSSVFIMTQIIQSGNVIDRGKLEEW